MKKGILACLTALCMSLQIISPAFASSSGAGGVGPFVLFEDDQIKQAIISKGFDTNHDGNLSLEEMERVGGSLDLSGKDISSLKGLQCTSLQSLYITKGSFTDVSPIEQMSDLRELTIKNTGITEVPHVMNPQKIRSMNLSDNQITDISAVSDMTELNSIVLSNNKITDISAFAGLQNLATLHLSNNEITDISALAAYTTKTETDGTETKVYKKLYALSIDGNPISDITPLGVLTGMMNLNMGNTAAEDLSALGGMSRLSTLYVKNVPATDFLPVLENCHSIWALDVSGTKFTNLQDIAKLSNLTSLTMDNTGITDLQFVSALTGLTSLSCKDNSLTDVSALLQMPHLQYAYFSGNQLTNIFPFIMEKDLIILDIAKNKLNLKDPYTASILADLKSRSVTVYDKNQDSDKDSIPTTAVGDVQVSAHVQASKQTVTNGELVAVKMICKNESSTALTDFDFCAGLPDGVTVTAGSEAVVSHIESLGAGEQIEKTVTFTVPEEYADLQLIVTESVKKNDQSYITGAVSMNIISVSLNVPYRTLSSQSFKVYGKATPGSKVTIVRVDGKTQTQIAEGVLNGEWYTAQIPAQDGPVVLQACIEKYGSKIYSDPVYVEIEPDTITLDDSRVWLREWIEANLYTGIPTFSSTVNSRLIGDSFMIYSKFTQDERISDVTFTFGDVTVKGKKNSQGYYMACISSWSATGIQDIKAAVTHDDGVTDTFVVGQVTVLIDPSGIITDEGTGLPVKGAEVLLEQKQESGSWEKWNAQQYMQVNPLITDDLGHYGWDVPEGVYRLIIKRAGYTEKIVERYIDKTGTETDISIPPVRTDVNVSITSDGTGAVIEQTAMEAAADAMQKLADMEVSNETAAEEIEQTVQSCIMNNKLFVSWKESFAKTEADYQKQGTLDGIMLLKNSETEETAEVVISRTITKLTQPIQEVKSLAEAALAELAVTNTTTADDVMTAVKAGIEDIDIQASWTTAFEKTEAQVGQAGTINGVITLTNTSTEETAEIVVEKTIAALPNPEMTIAEAKQAADAALANLAVTNATTADDVMTAVKAGIEDINIQASWTTAFEKTEAQIGEAGKITGVITLTKGEERAEITVEKTIAALPKPEMTIAEAKQAAETALANLAVTNATTADDVMTAVTNSIETGVIQASWTTAFEKTEAQIGEAGRIKGVITLTKGGERAEITVEKTIAALPKPEMTIAEAKQAAETALANLAVTNATTADDVMTAVTNSIETGVIQASWTTAFEKTEAQIGEAGKITGVITLTKGGERAEITVEKTIAALPNPEMTIAEAKQAAETALANLAVTNATTADDVMTAVANSIGIGVIQASWTTAFEKTDAQIGEAGKITGVITLTKGEEKAEITVEKIIPALPFSAENLSVGQYRFMLNSEETDTQLQALQQGTIYFSADIINHTQKNITGAVQILALYKNTDEGKVLSSVNLTALPEINAGETLAETKTNAVSVALQEGEDLSAYELDYMIWDGMANISPYLMQAIVLR